MANRLVVVGGGMAAAKLIEELHSLSQQAVQQSPIEVLVLGEEPVSCYNRILLSSVLSGELMAADIVPAPPNNTDRLRVRYCQGPQYRVQKIDTEQKTLRCVAGEQFDYDWLVMATGSRPRPLSEAEVSGLHGFRTLEDVRAFHQYCTNYRIRYRTNSAAAKHPVLVFGGGLLGLEAAYGLAKNGLPVILVHSRGWLMNRQLDAAAGALLQQQMESQGIQFVLGARLEHLHLDKENQLQGLCLTNGQGWQTDFCIAAIGIEPRVSLALEAGLAVEQGILVDQCMRTSKPDIYAIGECVEFQNSLFGLVAPIYRQARVCAQQLLGLPGGTFALEPLATQLKVSGIDLFSMGQVEAQADDETLLYRDAGQNIYKKLILRASCLVGAVLLGDIQDSAYYKELILSGSSVADRREHLMFGPSTQSAIDQ